MAVNKTRRTRVLGAAAAFVGVGAAGLVMAAPANAAVTGVKITTSSGYGSSQGVLGSGCSYDVEVAVNNQSPSAKVYFRALKETRAEDGTTELTPVPGSDANKVPSGSKATFTFEPGSAGKFTLQATQETTEGGAANWSDAAVEKTQAEATVGTGFQTPPSGSVELPFSGSCIVVLP
ncbi:hypothetical protein AAFP35_24200 [Gordonia sp. CPCC 206044]|uniref:hypothetical protein n=1 Tax=Gordonia sp. CPCC 206044 TaxID=3140793 RepID=UPI003AF38834